LIPSITTGAGDHLASPQFIAYTLIVGTATDIEVTSETE